MFSFFDLPIDVAATDGFSGLSKKDWLALRITATDMQRFAENGQLWAARCNKEHEIKISTFESFKKEMIVHLFKRGLHYSRLLDDIQTEYAKKIFEIQDKFFKKAYELIETINATHPIDPAILYIKGYIRCLGLGVTQNQEQGLEYLKEAARLGSKDAMLTLGLMNLNFPAIDCVEYKLPGYENRYLLKLCFSNKSLTQEEGLDWIKRAIDAGSDEAACVLASLEECQANKIQILTTAANKGGRHSPYILGQKKVERDASHTKAEHGAHFKAGFNYIKLAAERKNPEADYWLGRVYLGPFLTVKDGLYLRPHYNMGGVVELAPTEGLIHLKRAAAAGHGEATYLLGIFYRDGFINVNHEKIPVMRDLKLAIEWLTKGSQQFSVDCAMTLAFIFLDELHKKDETIFWFEKAAELGNKEAIKILAVLHTYGSTHLGLEVNEAKADKYLAGLNVSDLVNGAIRKVIDKGAEFAFKHDGVIRELNFFQYMKWSCRLAALTGKIGWEFKKILSDAHEMPEFKQISHKNESIVQAILELTKYDALMTGAALIERLIIISPVLIKPEFLDEHLVFLNNELERALKEAPKIQRRY